MRASAHELRVCRTHLHHQRSDELVEEGFADAELVPVANGAADDPPQHIATAFIRRQHAINDQERAGANVICDDAQRTRCLVRRARKGRGGANDVLE